MSDALPELFATAPRGVEPLLREELTALGATAAREARGGVAFTGDLRTAYRACYESRLANLVLLPLVRFPLTSVDDLYAAARKVDWPALFARERSFAIEVAGRSAVATHTHYAGLKIKDAIADGFREATGARPDVDTESPDIRVHLHLDGDHAALALDLSGGSLHRRGWRLEGVQAPLKENLAAAILVRAGWPALLESGAALLDPMCGSGTLAIEAALMAARVPAGAMRESFGFEAWSGHDGVVWKEVQQAARAQQRKDLPPVIACDLDEQALAAARSNARRAGVAAAIDFRRADALTLPAPVLHGLIVVNPPYGERLGDEASLVKLYSLLGDNLRRAFAGWRAAVFTARDDLTPRLGLRAGSIHSLYNGAIACKLLQFDIPEAPAEPPAATDFANRLQKNRKHLAKWARRKGVTCYRVYDADLTEYAVAVDQYESSGGELHLHVQEYAAPESIDPVKAERRLRQALSALLAEYALPPERMHFKQRRVQKHRGGETSQYQRQGEAQHYVEVLEHGTRLLVNLDDYLDTGLFLDHRPLRQRLQQEAAGKRFLNLFCYTGAATAHAARGGAAETVSVDLSNTYLDWALKNLQANGARADLDAPRTRDAPRRGPPAAHQLVRADVMEWLQEAARGRTRYDLVFCDPPTFSTSKKMEGTFDVQRDHAELILGAAALLADGGTLYFSTNRSRFKLDQAAIAAAGLATDDITTRTLDEDFRRPPPAHRCWRIARGGAVPEVADEGGDRN